MATLLAHITVKPGKELAFEAIARRMYEATHANERGVRRYEYWRGESERTYYTLESFDDYVGFLRHQTSEHHQASVPEFGEVIESLRLEWVDALDGAAPLAPTVAQDPPTDANEPMKHYAVRNAVHVAAWWEALRSA
jgi:quinol monooxygenase YgiN